jgi:hypothetical protein
MGWSYSNPGTLGDLAQNFTRFSNARHTATSLTAPPSGWYFSSLCSITQIQSPAGENTPAGLVAVVSLAFVRLETLDVKA